MRKLLFADNFYFWGHGATNHPGRIIINDQGKTLTLSDLHWIAAMRKKWGIPKMRYVTLDACFTADKGDYINAWLDITERFQGVTGETIEPTKGINFWGKRLVFHSPINYDPGGKGMVYPKSTKGKQ